MDIAVQHGGKRLSWPGTQSALSEFDNSLPGAHHLRSPRRPHCDLVSAVFTVTPNSGHEGAVCVRTIGLASKLPRLRTMVEETDVET